MLEPKEIEVDGLTCKISKLPAVAGRRVMSQYFPTAAPVIGNYTKNEELMLELMKYVSIKNSIGNFVPLMNQQLIDNHVVTENSWLTLMKLEKEMIEYNWGFFHKENFSKGLEKFSQKAQQLISSMSTHLSRLLSQMEKPHSES